MIWFIYSDIYHIYLLDPKKEGLRDLFDVVKLNMYHAHTSQIVHI